MSLIHLPLETIIRIVQYLDPVDIRSARTVCQYLKDIIATDLYLQYILELDKSGYVAPRLIRQDLDYAEMIQAIRNHRNRWKHVQLGEPKSIEVPDAVNTFLHERYFIDDVHVLHFGAMSTDGDITTSLHFHQLPSFNKGTDYKFWVHEGMGFTACSLAIQPEIDLMVLLEYCPLEPTTSWHQVDQSYRIHLRTMSSNKPHPLAMSSAPFLDVGKLPHRHFDDLSPMSLYGRILALRFVPNPHRPAFKPFVVLFDWIVGVEIGRVQLESYAGCFISFLSEEYFVVSQGYKYDVPSTNQAGNLLIFHIPLCVEEPQDRRARHIATLPFPRLRNHQNELRLRLCGEVSPIPDTTFWSKRIKPTPKIYELNRWNHICLHYETFDMGNPPRTSGQPQWCFRKDLGTCGLLYISSRALLALAANPFDSRRPNEPVVIPWETWGSYAACLPVMDTPSAYIWGRKSAFVHYDAKDESRSQLIVLDFIPSVLNHSSHVYNQECNTSSQPLVGQFIEPQVAMLGMRYRTTIINLKNKKHRKFCAYGLEINDEHLVTSVEPPRHITGRQFFSMCTI
ncbi:unnamed protein product [Rhizoctonia solani]|uniref:F-box domain-containing protein n=1 Tax=Rhizoctonia solani TaxID=456999 RepID=A0A8H3DFU8_9AGAM|nr:unnamed protein product [Rhizoctonia solani]CAE6528842.1 unnamed protein product [Rhizoctonia solani]